MAAIAQLGTSLKVGFTGSTVTSLTMEDSTKEATGEQAAIKDENNATGTILISDLGNRVTFSAIVQSAYAGSLPPALGSSITIGATIYRVESASYKQQRTQGILNVTAIKETSMTYT